ncbi:MAG: asparagine synthase (glutamine-hydrolyzing) [Candidatus Eremiobacteraeota bacterium]|nr:asparagine synthase (glutamine-hydrolyzing) [Candidatus Eremiobacteraeota bacterium]
MKKIIMCGIFGFTTENTPGFDRQVILEKMCDSIRYRGPDDEGYYIDDNISLGMCRLSIIDLDTGQQPIFNEDRSVLVVCNGEIYNFREIRDEMEKKGHKFHTSTDVEVIAHLYEEYGNDFIKKLDGMFGLALWDINKKKLILARDRMGIKPLFYYEKDGVLAFGSEIKTIMKIPGIDDLMDTTALYDYFSYNYIPAPRSIYSHIKKLLPGHYIVYENGKTSINKYWSLDPDLINYSRSEGEWAELIYSALKGAVRSHLVSDVPLGVLLSGGIDSTAITAIMTRMNVPVRTFSIGFQEKSFNELEYARLAAEKYGCEHHEEVARPDAVSLINEITGHFDEPYADSSALPVYLVSKLARKNVKVVLSGEGSDEIFAGYMTYDADMLAEKYQKIPGVVRNKILPGIVNLLPVSTKKVSFDYKARRFIRGANQDLITRHYLWKVIFDEDEKRKLILPDVYENSYPRDSIEVFKKIYNRGNPSTDPLNHILYADTGVYLPDDLLTKVDRMSMAHSIESRVPFLDHHLVELAFSIPSNLKLKGRIKKYILKKALRGIVPDRILNRKKAGFSIPAGKWFKNELKEFAGEILSISNIKKTGVLNPDYVRKIWNDHQEGKSENSRQIWGLMMFNLWKLGMRK